MVTFDLPCLLILASEVEALLMQAICREQEEVEVAGSSYSLLSLLAIGQFWYALRRRVLYSSPECWYYDGRGFLVKARYSMAKPDLAVFASRHD